jgi:hypothetical protein
MEVRKGRRFRRRTGCLARNEQKQCLSARGRNGQASSATYRRPAPNELDGFRGRNGKAVKELHPKAPSVEMEHVTDRTFSWAHSWYRKDLALAWRTIGQGVQDTLSADCVTDPRLSSEYRHLTDTSRHSEAGSQPGT